LDTDFHTLGDLFRQLGLPDAPAHVEQFIRQHGPLPAGMALCDAPFWTPSQARFLREQLQADADWSGVVDRLATRLSTPLPPHDGHLLIVVGSARKASVNRALAEAAAALAVGRRLRVTLHDPQALVMPLYHGDEEAAHGVPAEALRLQQAVADSDGLLVVSPEYNGFPTPLLVNAFDWLSRIPAAPPRPSGLATTANRPVALLSASPGPGGALRSMNFLRQYLQMAFQMVVVPQQFALGRAHEAFDDSGALRDPKATQAVSATLGAWATLARALREERTPAA
jgi:chromate reductase, NAD(P)H dehydrogenase (quinone)